MSRKPSSVITLPNFRLRLLGASAILFILIASFFAWQVHVAALEREASTKIQVQTYARAVSGQLSSTLKTVDLALKGVGHATAMLSDADSLSELRTRGMLLAQLGTLDSEIFLVASDSEGTAITSSNGVPVRGVSFAERDFFRAHKTGRESGLVVAEPVVGKVTKRHVLVLSRPLQTSTGEFAGVVWAPIDVRVISRLLQDAMFKEGLSIALVHESSAKLIARVPEVDGTFASSVRDAPLLSSLQKAPNGHFEFSSLVDRQRRIYAYEHLSGLPLVVTVGFSTAALDGARMRDASSASMVLLLVATILVLTNTLALKHYAAARAREVTWQVRQAELEALLNAIPAPIIVAHDPECQRITGNHAARRLLSIRDVRNIVGPWGTWEGNSDAWQTLERDEIAAAVLPLLGTAASTGQPTQPDELEVPDSSGATRFIYGGAAPLFDDRGSVCGAIASFVDTTERHQNETLRAEKEAAEVASRSKSEFLSRISHELRTPLNAILGFSQLLQLEHDRPLASEQLQRVGHIRMAGEHLLRLISDLLDISSLEAGALRVNSEKVCVAVELRAVMPLISGQAEAAGISIRDDASAAAPIYVLGDKTRIRQVIVNLVSNAIKYGRRGGIVSLGIAFHGSKVRLTVSDNGIGMSAVQQAELFQPFNRLGRDHTTIQGTGIGLVITKQLIEAMGGSLSVISETGVGSSFMVDLLAARVAAAWSSADDGERKTEIAPSD